MLVLEKRGSERVSNSSPVLCLRLFKGKFMNFLMLDRCIRMASAALNILMTLIEY
jgi:hypothetical protein